jgi:hypothetical protein
VVKSATAGTKGRNAKLPAKRGRGVFVPGIWQKLYQHHLDLAAADDPRGTGFGMTDCDRAKLNASPHSSVSAAKATLAAMDRGEPQMDTPPSRREWPEVADVDWVRGPGRCPRVMVWPDDLVEEHWPDWAQR